jgi:hypothetical protein
MVMLAEVEDNLEAVFRHKNLIYAAQSCDDEFIAAEGAEVEVVGEVLAERLHKRLVVRRRVQLLCTEKFLVAKTPGALQHLYVEKCLEIVWDILEESKNSAFRVLITQSVEYEAFFRDEGIAISRNPIFG